MRLGTTADTKHGGERSRQEISSDLTIYPANSVSRRISDLGGGKFLTADNADIRG